MFKVEKNCCEGFLWKFEKKNLEKLKFSFKSRTSYAIIMKNYEDFHYISSEKLKKISWKN